MADRRQFSFRKLRENHFCTDIDNGMKNDKIKILPLTPLVQSRPIRRELNDGLYTRERGQTGQWVHVV